MRCSFGDFAGSLNLMAGQAQLAFGGGDPAYDAKRDLIVFVEVDLEFAGVWLAEDEVGEKVFD